jgi:tungstate transport system substrate-binding protein
MRRLVSVLAAVLAAAGAGCGGSGKKELILATTTSTQDSGLLSVLIPAFEKDSGYTVKTVAVGSGQAIALGQKGEADVLLVHSPADELKLMATGKAGPRLLVMHNDFVLVGPPSDPAHVKGAAIAAAMKAIASADAPFISRGDASGTNQFELKVWKAAGITPKGAWYEKSGQGMGATLQIAAQKQAYTIADRGTWLATGNGKGLAILVQGGSGLLNVYHVIEMSRKAGSKVNVNGAKAFADWIVSPRAQALIGSFKKAQFGRSLFVPDAGKTDAQVKQAA